MTTNTTTNTAVASAPIDRIAQLRAELRRHDRLYYVESTPEIDDNAYDVLFRELQELEAAHPEAFDPSSPTQVVGGAPVGGQFETVEHSVPMLSIDNTFDLAGLDTFCDRVQHGIPAARYAVEYKLDGLALSLLYQGGVLVRALTRGNGTAGADVTHNALTIRNIPRVIDYQDRLEVRGEACISHTDFAVVRERHLLETGDTLANSRNAASGAIQQSDPKEAYKRHLAFLPYGHGVIDIQGLQYHAQVMGQLREHGFPSIPESAYNLTAVQVKDHIAEMIEKVPMLDYPIDGIVVKVESFHHRGQLGATDRHVKWALAYKWERYEEETTLNSISVQVGKHGTLTPVAELEPVEIAETTVSRASLFNWDEIERIGCRVGDRVVVEKAGKIIPHVLRVNHEHRPDDAVPYARPTRCPCCQGPVVQEGAYTRCTTLACPDKLKAVFASIGAKKYLDIRGMGPALVDELVDRGLLQNFQDLFELHTKHDELLEIPRVGAKKIETLVRQIEAAKNVEPYRLLASFNIPNVGTTAAKQLMREYGGINEALFEAKVEELRALPGIGDVIANSLRAFLVTNEAIELVVALTLADCKLTADPEEEVVSGPLSGLTIVPTGDLSQFTRDEIKAAILANGGRPTGSVSRKTSYVLAGTAPGPKKIAKAHDLSIPVITEEQFIEMIGG